MKINIINELKLLGYNVKNGRNKMIIEIKWFLQ